MSTCPIPAIIDRMMVVLAARSGLDDTTQRSGPFDATSHTEVVQFSEINFRDDQESMGMANRGLDFTVQGIIEVTKPGAGETVIAATRSRAFDLFDEVESALIAEFVVTGVNLEYGEVTLGKYVPLLVDTGHRGHLEFTVRFVAQLG